jgi:3',5'-cyclic AMP phosphodiesterase CpdA
VKRNDFLAHVGWTGLGLTFALNAEGVARAAVPGQPVAFAQISDSHIGFTGKVNDHPAQTLQMAVDALNALPEQPAFVVHTGDVTHLAKADEFGTARDILGKLRAPLYVIPGEHDVINAEGAARFSDAFGRTDAPKGWYAWDLGGVHYVALVNVFSGETMGQLGTEQLAWLANDLRARPVDTPIVVFGHVPLYALYPQWGWTTGDGAQALALLRRFSSVTVLNGHIHQVIEHRDGAIRFATAAATAYPQPAPGTASGPGPLAVPPDHLLDVIGYRTVELVGGEATWENRTLRPA